mmetsp:Transcript_29352/g.93830  ORF Transcript_29352/g.93830 Transcript_29352/m.93830 type:complete len:254 (-) Transcript_29352:134-895(-)
MHIHAWGLKTRIRLESTRILSRSRKLTADTCVARSWGPGSLSQTGTPRCAWLAAPKGCAAIAVHRGSGAAAASAAAVLVVVARGAIGSLHALLDGGLVVALVVELALDIVREHLERLAQQLELRLRRGARLLRLAILVGVALERALLVPGLDLERGCDGRHGEQRVVVGPPLLAHLKLGPLVRGRHLRVLPESLHQPLEHLQRLIVTAQVVQRRGARHKGARAVVLCVDGDGAILERRVKVLEPQPRRRAVRV